MKIFGEVKAILNNDNVIVEMNEHASEGEEFVVIEVVKNQQFTDATGLEELHYPKGKVKISLQQGQKLYLANTSETKQVTKRVFKESPITNFNPFSKLFGEAEEVVESVPVKRSGAVNSEQSLKLDLSNKISVGDKLVRG